MTENQRKPVIRFAEFTDAWEQRKLSEIASLRTGFPFSSEEFEDDGDYLVITNGNVKDKFATVDGSIGNHISVSNDDIIRDYLLNIDDILVTMDGTVGRTARVVEDCQILAQRVGRITAGIDSGFLFQWLNTGNFSRKMVELSHGGTIKHISLDEIGSYKSSIPNSSKEQHSIGMMFLDIDNLITLHQREYDKTLNIKKAMLEKMFPKNGEDRPEIRFKGFTDAWEQRKLGDISEIKTGSSDAQDSVLEGIYPFFVRSDEVQRSNKYLYDGEAILIPGEGRLGEIYHYIKGKFDFHQRVYKISDFDDINGRFVLYEMQHSFKHHALKNTAKATVDSIRLPTLTEYEIQIPSIGEQGLIGTFFEHLDDLITLHQRELKKLQNMKKALLEKMFVQG